MQKEISTNKIIRFEIIETVTLETLLEPRFMIIIIYGRKRDERVRFRHQFKNRKYVEKMYDEMLQFKKMPLNVFLKNENQREIQVKFQKFTNPILKLEAVS